MYDKVNHRGRIRLTEYRLRESDHDMSKLGRFITRENMDVIELREHEVLGQKTDTVVIFVVPVKDKVETQSFQIPFFRIYLSFVGQENLCNRRVWLSPIYYEIST